jgi:hypothetical protein
MFQKSLCRILKYCPRQQVLQCCNITVCQWLLQVSDTFGIFSKRIVITGAAIEYFHLVCAFNSMVYWDGLSHNIVLQDLEQRAYEGALATTANQTASEMPMAVDDLHCRGDLMTLVGDIIPLKPSSEFSFWALHCWSWTLPRPCNMS